MKIEATREEIDRTAALLALLRKFEVLRRFGENYSHSTSRVQMSGNAGSEFHDIRGEAEHSPPAKNPVDEVVRQIDIMYANAISEVGARAVAMIKAAMPIPVA